MGFIYYTLSSPALPLGVVGSLLKQYIWNHIISRMSPKRRIIKFLSNHFIYHIYSLILIILYILWHQIMGTPIICLLDTTYPPPEYPNRPSCGSFPTAFLLFSIPVDCIKNCVNISTTTTWPPIITLYIERLIFMMHQMILLLKLLLSPHLSLIVLCCFCIYWFSVQQSMMWHWPIWWGHVIPGECIGCNFYFYYLEHQVVHPSDWV